ncbi:MAG: UDP-N-acetylmuramate dehydrogenase [Oscillospiraceae bacterium]|nr:UDP-N-acetylmuramate dehydrogenase [Oscillospiraceae bacterium]
MAWETALDERIGAYLPELTWLRDEPLAKHTSFRIGGAARRMAFPKTAEELIVLDGVLREADVRRVLLGNGTNVLFPDEGLDAVVIATGAMASVRRTGKTELAADAGASLARLAAEAWRAGLTGLEFAHGIPGSVGGGVVMNAGAYDGSLADVLTEATALFPDGVRTLGADELRLSYRHSVFTDEPEAVVLRASVRLRAGEPDAIKARMDDLMARRKASQPLEYPSAGSAFKRPAGQFAGRLIEDAGLKGARVGGAEVSPKHAGFIVNVGGATCADVLALIERIQTAVYDAFGVRLEPEIKIVR